ncbi:MAG: hypothetical protein HUJ22_09085 [Gracilimonas sp.]|nr:hypothetical protein [Gracilimonas sp.]
MIFALSILLLSGCSELSNNGKEKSSEVEFVFNNSTADTPDFDVVFNDNGSTLLHRSQFSQDNSQLSAGPFETVQSGSLDVEIILLKDKLPRSFGELSLPLKKDWRYRVIFQIVSGDPTEGCLGCLGYKSFAIDSTFKSNPDDSLYIVWGGNSISDPVDY